MKFYTLQNLKAWEKAQQCGYLTGNKEYVWEEFIEPYNWMRSQMYKLNRYNGEYPIWLWIDTSNINFSEIIENEWVLLEINLPKDEVLLSNFESWNVILNDGYFGEEKILDIKAKEENWECIFDKDKLEELGYGFDDYDLQGVIGRIDLDNIKVVKYIVNDK